MTDVRRFTDHGIKRFTDFLDSLTGDTPEPYPANLLTNPEATEEIRPATAIEKREFGRRYDAAEYLYHLFAGSGLTEVEHDRGLWAWLSFFYFDELCPPNAKGQRKPGQHARWVPESGDSWRYYRHLLAGPYRIYAAHSDSPERALLVLCGPLDRPGDIVEQVASRQEMITNRGVMATLSSLYYDPESAKPRRGAANKDGKGTVRRFTDILNQLDVTWDLYSLEVSDLLPLLPQEFSRFRKAASV